MITMTIAQLQWDRLTERAKMQQAPAEFWSAVKTISRPTGGQISVIELQKLRALFDQFTLSQND